MLVAASLERWFAETRRAQVERMVLAAGVARAVSLVPPGAATVPPAPAPPVTSYVTRNSFSSWQCVADAETSGNWQAHGPQYSSAFGMLNEAVRERADSPASAARILAGTASHQEQIDAAERELARFGVGAWGVLTRAKCAV